jgi:hypothetical protein
MNDVAVCDPRPPDCDLPDPTVHPSRPFSAFRRYVRPISTTHDWPSKNRAAVRARHRPTEPNAPRHSLIPRRIPSL